MQTIHGAASSSSQSPRSIRNASCLSTLSTMRTVIGAGLMTDGNSVVRLSILPSAVMVMVLTLVNMVASFLREAEGGGRSPKAALPPQGGYRGVEHSLVERVVEGGGRGGATGG